MARVIVNNKNFLFRHIGNECLSFNLKTLEVFCLNPTATYIWKKILEGQSLSSIKKMLIRRFKIEPEQIQKDFDFLMKFFIKKKMLKTK